LPICRERGDLDERVTLTCSWRYLEVRGIVLDDALSAIVLRNGERLDQGIMHCVEELLPLARGSSFEDLDSHQWHRSPVLDLGPSP